MTYAEIINAILIIPATVSLLLGAIWTLARDHCPDHLMFHRTLPAPLQPKDVFWCSIYEMGVRNGADKIVKPASLAFGMGLPCVVFLVHRLEKWWFQRRAQG